MRQTKLASSLVNFRAHYKIVGTLLYIFGPGRMVLVGAYARIWRRIAAVAAAVDRSAIGAGASGQR